jgi:hypothetical protein
MKTDTEVLDALLSKHDTDAKVAQLLGLANAQTLHWWRKRPSGISWEYRAAVFALARKSGIRLSAEWINAKPKTPPTARRPARRKPKRANRSKPRRVGRNGLSAPARPAL